MKNSSSRKKKLIIFTDAFSGGGAEDVMFKFGIHLDKEFDLLHIAKWMGPKRKTLNKRYINLNQKKSIQCFFLLKRIIANFKPDCVFVSTIHNNVIILLLKFLFFRNLNVVIRESSVPSKMNKFSIKDQIIDRLFAKNLYQHAKRIIVQSEDMKKDVLKKYKIDNSKVIKIYNPIHMFPKSDNKHKFDNRISIINIGRLSVEKGHIRMLEIFAKLSKKFHLSIAGEGSERMVIEKKIAELNLGDRVKLLGFQQEEDLAETIAKSDVYLQTSYVEGFPNSLAQAAYAGLRVIAYDVPGGTKEIISKKNGVLVQDGSETEMVKQLMKIMSKKITYNEVREELDSRFNISLIIKDLKKALYE